MRFPGASRALSAQSFHGIACSCTRCNRPHPNDRRLTWQGRARRVLAGVIVGLVIVMALAAHSAASPLIVFGL